VRQAEKSIAALRRDFQLTNEEYWAQARAASMVVEIIANQACATKYFGIAGSTIDIVLNYLKDEERRAKETTDQIQKNRLQGSACAGVVDPMLHAAGPASSPPARGAFQLQVDTNAQWQPGLLPPPDKSIQASSSTPGQLPQGSSSTAELPSPLQDTSFRHNEWYTKDMEHSQSETLKEESPHEKGFLANSRPFTPSSQTKPPRSRTNSAAGFGAFKYNESPLGSDLRNPRTPFSRSRSPLRGVNLSPIVQAPHTPKYR